MNLNIDGRMRQINSPALRLGIALMGLLIGCIIVILGTFSNVARAAPAPRAAPSLDTPSPEMIALMDKAVAEGGILIHCSEGVCTNLMTQEVHHSGQPSGLYMTFPNDPRESEKIAAFQREYLKLVSK